MTALIRLFSSSWGAVLAGEDAAGSPLAAGRKLPFPSRWASPVRSPTRGRAELLMIVRVLYRATSTRRRR